MRSIDGWFHGFESTRIFFPDSALWRMEGESLPFVCLLVAFWYYINKTTLWNWSVLAKCQCFNFYFIVSHLSTNYANGWLQPCGWLPGCDNWQCLECLEHYRWILFWSSPSITFHSLVHWRLEIIPDFFPIPDYFIPTLLRKKKHALRSSCSI